MVSKLPQEFRKFLKNCYHLRRILRETQRSLDEITLANIFPEENLREQVLSIPLLHKLNSILECQPALIILGQNCEAKASLVNALLGEAALPTSGDSWRWLRIFYGRINRVSLTLGLEFEVVEKLKANEEPWTTIPTDDLTLPESEEKLLPDHWTMLEVELCNPVLRDNVQLIVPSNCYRLDVSAVQEMLHRGLEHVLPVLLFAINQDILTDQNMNELRELKETFSNLPVFFVYTKEISTRVLPQSTVDLTESEQHQLQTERMLLDDLQDTHLYKSFQTNSVDMSLMPIVHQLTTLGFLLLEEPTYQEPIPNRQSPVKSDFVECLQKLDKLIYFVRGSLQTYLVQASTMLNEVHGQCLRRFILSAFDMAREIQITPRRIQYAQEKEADLYKNLMAIANEKQEEITHLIQITLQEMSAGLIEKAASYRYQGLTLLEGEEVQSAQAVGVATAEIQHLVLSRLSNSVANQLVKSVDCLQDTFVGTLQRCLQSLEKSCIDQEGSLRASDAVKQILSAAYNVELTTSTSSSLLHTFLERLRKVLHNFQLPWTAAPRLDAAWRQRVAIEMIESLSPARLARIISAQFRDRVKSSHESFQSALRSLESHYSGQLERTEEQRIAIRKYHAPRLARLALESTSMCDMICFGIPQLGKEIGRGQYGVVFSCESWGGIGPCAIKSVVPPDEKHWNDLAMEFYYTRIIPDHKHIVKLRGSVVDHSYGGGCTPAVLLIMDRLGRDLYCGLRSGLRWLIRLQIAIDVVEGIRYLHSQGLVHRDIKLKNVLLDYDNRAKLTDLGFCIPEAMMSGSIVGTPVHMAPELLSGHYDSSVDVYAFGILFWYICAGHVRLPYVFEQFQNKEQLWLSVKKGIRPERLPHFDEDCWHLMEQSWCGEPSKRPLLGYVLPLLESIMSRYADSLSSSDL